MADKWRTAGEAAQAGEERCAAAVHPLQRGGNGGGEGRLSVTGRTYTEETRKMKDRLAWYVQIWKKREQEGTHPHLEHPLER